MRNSILYLILFISTLLTSLKSEEEQIHHNHTSYIDGDKSSQFMFAYQIGYAEIHSKNNQMLDDSGALLGIHLMKVIKSETFEDKLFLAAGAHTIFSEDKHVGLMLGIMYQLNEDTMLSIMPGLILMKHEVTHSHGQMPMQMPMAPTTNPEWDTEKAFHIEISHTINLFNHELNPSVGWMSSSSHDQYSLGLNFHF